MDCQRAAADLWKLIDGFKVSQALHAAAVLGVADRIAEGVRGSDAIADAARADRASTYRLLRALAAQGVLREEEGRAFSLTPLGECLRSDAEVSLGPYAVLIGQPYYWQAWGHLPHAVRTGDSAFRAVHGEPSWAYRERHAEQNAIADAARRGVSVAGSVAYISHFPCINCAKILAAAGVREIKYHDDYNNDDLVVGLLGDAGVTISKY